MVSNETTKRGNTKKEKRFRNYIKVYWDVIGNVIVAIFTIASFILLLNLMLNSVFKGTQEKQYKQMENAISYVYDELNEKDVISDVLANNQTEVTRQVGNVTVTLNNTEITARINGYDFGYVRAPFNFKGELQYERINDNGFRIFVSIVLSLIALGIVFSVLLLIKELFKEFFW